MILGNRKFVGVFILGCVIAALALVFSVVAPDKTVRYAAAPRESVPAAPAPPPREPLLQTAIAAFKPSDLRADLEKMYAESDYRPFWTSDRAGRKRLAAVDTIAASLSEQGLNPSFLTTAKAALANARTDAERETAELGMSAAVLRAAKGQRFGFISAGALGWNLAPDQGEVAAYLGEAISRHGLADYFESLKPRHPQFAALTEGLAKYRDIAAAGGWASIPADKEIKFGEADPRLPALRARLAAEGYISADAGDDVLPDAVKAFQARNGLNADGRAGRGTLAALNVPVEARIGQITANLERWRHMRHEEPDAYVIANAADQTVAVVRNGREELRLRTVVGARKHATPILEAKMTGVTLNPPWEIPTSIITNEIIPKLEEDPYYLEDSNMEVVSGNWDNPKSLRVRQRPGTGNALGFMKFQMQNQWNIYLHDTPSRSLFAKDDRTFSHGCVRVQHPEELAALLTGKSIDELNEGIASGETRTIPLQKALPVFVLYWTAFTDRDGEFNFRRDAYDRDKETLSKLAEAGLYPPSRPVAEVGN
ncbi:MAG: murein L,D-transpeptidase [Rhodospirillaceae bacterium]